jgi:hypothetical protein
MANRFPIIALRWAIKIRSKWQEPIIWKPSPKIFLLSQLFGAIAYFHFARAIPPPGWAIAVLGAMAAVMAFRGEAGELERVCWVMVIFSLMIIEMIAIGREHKRQDASSEQILRNGFATLHAIDNLKQVKPKEGLEVSSAVAPKPKPKPVKPSITDKDRGLLTFGPAEIGIFSQNTTQAGRLFVNVRCENAGATVLIVGECDAVINIYDGSMDSFAANIALQTQYLKDYLSVHQHAKDASRSVAPHEYMWFSAPGPVATPALVQAINNDKKLLVVVGEAVYQDFVTTRKNEMCVFAQPPLSAPQPTWHLCTIPTGEMQQKAAN